MINTGELRGRRQALLVTQGNYSMVYPHINEASIDQGGPIVCSRRGETEHGTLKLKLQRTFHGFCIIGFVFDSCYC